MIPHDPARYEHCRRAKPFWNRCSWPGCDEPPAWDMPNPTPYPSGIEYWQGYCAAHGPAHAQKLGIS